MKKLGIQQLEAGLADNYGLAFFKAQEAAGQTLPLAGTLLLTVSPRDRQGALEVATRFSELNFTIKATKGTPSISGR